MEDKGSTKFIWIIAIVLVVAALGALAYSMTRDSDNGDTTSDLPTNSQMETSQTDGTESSDTTTIVFTDNGFDPLKYVSKVGQPVTVRNDSSTDLEFSSNDHPTHLEHPGLNLSTLAPGESASFTPEQAGTFEFHDHLNSQFTGTLTVE